MSPLVVAAGFAAAIALALYAVLGQAEERATVRDSLRQLDDYQVENQRERDLLNPLGTRVFGPLTGFLTELGKRFTPVGYVQSVRKKLVIAGKPTQDDLDRFLAVRVITIALVPAAGALLFVARLLNNAASRSLLHGKMPVVLFAFMALGLVLGPDAMLNRKVEARQNKVRTELPDILDLLTISVEAGLGFDQALDRTIAAVPGPMSEEFQRMLGEVRAGSARSDALRGLDDRTDVPEVRSFVLALLQADTFGVSIGRVLRSLSDEMRVRRRQLAQEKAQKAPVKMLIPMVFCIFPALFIVVIGPAVINIYRTFNK
jgi:tight adherence protein C